MRRFLKLAPKRSVPGAGYRRGAHLAGDRIAVRGNNTHSVRELVAAAPAFQSFRASSVTAIRDWFASPSQSPNSKPTNGSSPITRNVTPRRSEKSPTGLAP
ncbi:hypothetical protein [Mesorhizobium sp. RIZ17]|uniref:hypothetical protein n=1 Tax=Mesorhizobium sp. RIZ17 TaxID=3132743 RepID=UPI003DA870A5